MAWLGVVVAPGAQRHIDEGVFARIELGLRGHFGHPGETPA
jgi:hypothetical protein